MHARKHKATVEIHLQSSHLLGKLGTLSNDNDDVPDVNIMAIATKLIFSLFLCSDTANSYSGS